MRAELALTLQGRRGGLREAGVVPVHTPCVWRRFFGRARVRALLLPLLWEVRIHEGRGASCEDGQRCYEQDRQL